MVVPKPTSAEGTGTAAAKLGGGLVIAKTKPLVVMPAVKKAAVPVPASPKVSPKPKAKAVDGKTSSSEESDFAASMKELVKDMDKRKASCKGGKKATKAKTVKKDKKSKTDKGKQSKKSKKWVKKADVVSERVLEDQANAGFTSDR